MSKITDFYSQLAQSTGMYYDAGSNVIHGQRSGFDLLIYAADDTMPYVLSIHTAVKTPTGAALTRDEFNSLSQSVSALGVGYQSGNNVVVPLVSQVDQKLRDSLPEMLPAALSGLAAFLIEKGCQPCCSTCGMTENVSAFKSEGSYFHLCRGCEAEMRAKLDATAAKKAKKENVVGGVIGALIGSLVGVLCIVLLGQLGYVAALSGVVMAFGALKGYELLGGKLTKKGIVISVVIMLIMAYVGDRLDLAIRLMQELGTGSANLFDCYRAIPRFLKAELIDVEAYARNLIMLYAFLLLGAVPTIRSRAKEKKDEGLLVKIGSPYF
ncbi:MAG: hypothetical protein NC517_13340 [Firmicutes bacterium]|nr:hypothetical protein [Bacillota bacterium]